MKAQRLTVKNHRLYMRAYVTDFKFVGHRSACIDRLHARILGTTLYVGKKVPTEQKHGRSPFWKITVCEERSKQDEGAKAAEVNVLSTRKPAYIQNLYITISAPVPIKFALSGAVFVGDGRKFAFLFRKILIDVNTDKEMVVLIDSEEHCSPRQCRSTTLTGF